MNKSIDFLEPIKPLIRINKNFIFKGKKYPIDFSLIKKNSNYFYLNRDKYKIADIELQEESIKITEEEIQTFISCLQNEPFQINNDNVFPLYLLSSKYDVPELLKRTSEYIKCYDENLVLQSILFKAQLQNQPNENFNIDLKTDEEKIASNFFYFINDEKLFSLPIPVLYRILNNYELNINEIEPKKQEQVIDFLFKCLKKFRKEASVLFSNLDLENQRIGVLKKLLHEYSELFDFNMINPKFLLKSTESLLSELTALKLEFSTKLSEMSEAIKAQNEKLRLEEQKNAKFRESLEKNQKEHSVKIMSEVKKNHKIKEAQTHGILTKQNEKIEELKQMVVSNQNELPKKMNDLKNEMSSAINALKFDQKEKKRRTKENDQKTENIIRWKYKKSVNTICKKF